MMIALIAVFAICIAAEVYVSNRRGLRVYEIRETLGHLAMGLGQQASNILLMGTLAVIYVWLHRNFAVQEIDLKNPVSWISLILLSDLAFYVVHRLSHRVNLFVATHDVHHQAHDFNHASALRQSWTSRSFMFFFYAPLAVIGFPVHMLLASQGVNFLVQFLVHNGVIRRRLGFLEYVFVTPRSHRVHHGTNHHYLDKNFGGMFIIWDRLFGTYCDLDDRVEPVIGFSGGANHYSPIVANFNYFQKIAFVMRRRTGWKARLAVLFGTPEMLEGALAKLAYVERYPRPEKARLLRLNLVLCSALLGCGVAALIYLLRHQQGMGVYQKLQWIAAILLSIRLIGWLLERPREAHAAPRTEESAA